MRRAVFGVAILLFAARLSAVGPHDLPCRSAAMRHTTSGKTLQTHEGSSPFPPPDADDTIFIADTGDGLDTDCTYASGGPLIIHVPITRYVGPVKADGTLQAPATLIATGLISENAQLRLPAYDVDVNGDPTDPTVPPEVDRVLFNGHDVGTLTGDNDIWKLNEFEVPIQWVRFPGLSGDGGPPVPADNVIEIDIDTASGGVDNWCTSVDWVELQFAAIAPIFLVHGTGSTPGGWDPDFTSFFGSSNAPWSNQIQLDKFGSIAGNGMELGTQLHALATQAGAKRCHIIAHSKGGLDTRAYLNSSAYDPSQLRVLSVYTLSTPHHGTTAVYFFYSVEASVSPALYALQQALGLLPALSDMTPSSMAAFNEEHPGVPGDVLFYSYGAEADVNGDGQIDANEARCLINGCPDSNPSPEFATLLHRWVGNTTNVTLTVGHTTLWGVFTFPDIELQSGPFASNDCIVPSGSAQAPFGTYIRTISANHTSMKSTELAREILDHILSDFPNQ